MKRAGLVLLVLVAACGGGGGGKSDSGVLTAQSIADKAGCSSFTEDESSSRELFVADSGDCTLGGDTVHVRTFTNNETRDNWLKVAKKFGGSRYDVANRVVAYGENQQTADALKAKLGGSIQT
ncbi:MAG: hypothetical protein ACXV5Q_00610 [Frankiaceae bacterium]